MKLLRRRPKVRSDHRRFDMGKMKGWGYNAFWWPQSRRGERACIFGPRPRPGDVVIDGADAFVVGEVDTPHDPGDQHFIEVRRWGPTTDLPDAKSTPNTTGYLL